jgi:hypothetical protein
MHEIENQVNGAHAGRWNTMILRTQYVLQYLFDNGNSKDMEHVDIASWNWI